MASVVFDLSDVARPSQPAALDFGAGRVAAEEVLPVAPEVEALPVEEVVLVVPVVVLSTWEYLQSDSISSSSVPPSEVEVAADPNSLAPDRLGNFLQRPQAGSQLNMILVYPSIELPHPKLYHTLTGFLPLLHLRNGILHP